MDFATLKLQTLDEAKAWAAQQDNLDGLRHFRDSFHIPSRHDLKSKTLASKNSDQSPPSTYLCGNSLGVQPKSTITTIQEVLQQWRMKGVTGHFVEHEDASLPPFLHYDDYAARLMAPIVGAQTHEVAVMGSLTTNLHLLMVSFYRPTKKGEGRYKILLEGKAFPSDHFAVESQIRLAGLEPEDAMVLLEPEDQACPLLSTRRVLETIDKHADELALVLLPGIQFYTGQFFDIKTITAHAHSKGIMVGWDCAHAAGNVELQLHDWDVDFAVWCTYKYLNSGPGSHGAIFVHDKHGKVDVSQEPAKYRPRLTGWWGDDKSTRFQMTNKFRPRPGAAGFQVSNLNALDVAAVIASLRIFGDATMPKLRQKSLSLTGFLEYLLCNEALAGPSPPYTIITPKDPHFRGAQLSILLDEGLLDPVLESLEEHGVVIDERKPDVIRVAPAPLYNNHADVIHFCEILQEALQSARSSR